MARKDYKAEAYECYASYVTSKRRSLTDEEWERIWSVIKHYVTAVVRGKDFNCSDFDLDDHLAELQLELWTRLSGKKIPADSVGLFVGSIRVVTQQFLIGNYRKVTTEERSRDKYAETASTTHEVDMHERMWAAQMACDHKDVIATKMVERARFEIVDFDLARNYVELECQNADARTFIDMIAETGYWDPYFMFTYMTILYRWVYYDVTFGPEQLVA